MAKKKNIKFIIKIIAIKKVNINIKIVIVK